MSFEFIQSTLKQRQEQGLFRQERVVQNYHQQFVVVDGKQYLNFSSNDYLGLAQAEKFDCKPALPMGSGGSPLVTGFSLQHQRLCDFLAEQLGREAVLLCSSGFAANAGICQAFGQESKVHFIADKLAHASIMEGAFNKHSNFLRFRHNNLEHLEAQIQKASGDVMVMTEGVFSMDGDVPPIPALVEKCHQYNCWLSLDDAHGFGVLGDSGMGTIEEYGLTQQQAPVLMGTFGKAIGTGGAFVAGSAALIDYLKNFSRHYIYSTAFSPLHADMTLQNIKRCQKEKWRREKLNSNIACFKANMTQVSDKLLPSNTPIQPIIIGDPEKALAMEKRLHETGFWVKAIRYPTVPKQTDRIRITLSALHESEDIKRLTLIIKKLLSEFA